MGTSLQGPCPIAGEQGPVCAGCSQEVDIQDGHQLRDAARSGRISGRHEKSICAVSSGQSPDAVAVPPQLPRDVDRPEQPAISNLTRTVGTYEVQRRDLAETVQEATHPTRRARVGTPPHGCINDDLHLSVLLRFGTIPSALRLKGPCGHHSELPVTTAPLILCP